MSAHRAEVVIVGAGFAGLGCARALAKHEDVHVILVDRHDYHHFQPLLYQVATSQLARADVVVGEVTAVDPAERAVTTADGRRFTADALVLAAGSRGGRARAGAPTAPPASTPSSEPMAGATDAGGSRA